MQEDVNNKNKGPHIVQYPSHVSFCAGCTACEIVCALVHDGRTGPMLRRIYVDRDNIHMNHTIQSCQQCLDHPCYNACPKKDKALCKDEDRQLTYINTEECIGCGLCIKACPYEPKRILFNSTERKNRKAIKCDLCRNREEGPACVQFCQVRCIGLSTSPIPLE